MERRMSVVIRRLATTVFEVVVVERLPVLLMVEVTLFRVVIMLTIVPIVFPALIGIVLIPLWLIKGRLEVRSLALVTDLIVEVPLRPINRPVLIMGVREVVVITISRLVSSVAALVSAAAI